MTAVVSSKQKILCEMEDFYGRLYALQSPLYLNPTPVAPSRFSPTLYQRTSRRQHWRNWLSPETEKWRSPKWSRSYNRDLESRGTPVLEHGSFIKRERDKTQDPKNSLWATLSYKLFPGLSKKCTWRLNIFQPPEQTDFRGGFPRSYRRHRNTISLCV